MKKFSKIFIFENINTKKTHNKIKTTKEKKYLFRPLKTIKSALLQVDSLNRIFLLVSLKF